MNESTTDIAPASASRVRRAAAAAVVALLTLAACTSDPGPRRVAKDIIEAQALENPELDEECMLTALDGFSDGELEDISSQLDSANADTKAEGQVALDDFEAALAACNS